MYIFVSSIANKKNDKNEKKNHPLYFQLGHWGSGKSKTGIDTLPLEFATWISQRDKDLF